MAILDILDKPVFHRRFKLPLHILTGILVVVVIGLSVPRLFMKNQSRTRANATALGMGAKSFVLLTYMLATEHIQRLKRWHSYKANVIISCLEIVFWGAVAFLVLQGNLSECEGVICYLSWVVVGLAIVINHLEIYASAIAIRELHEHRKMRNGMPLSSVTSHGTAMEEIVQEFPSQPENIYRSHHEQHNAVLPTCYAHRVRDEQ